MHSNKEIQPVIHACFQAANLSVYEARQASYINAIIHEMLTEDSPAKAFNPGSPAHPTVHAMPGLCEDMGAREKVFHTQFLLLGTLCIMLQVGEVWGCVRLGIHVSGGGSSCENGCQMGSIAVWTSWKLPDVLLCTSDTMHWTLNCY